MYNAHDQALLERHVTNVDGNVYCIANLPEEVIAVIFAYVSRSPLSFRDNLLRLVKEGDVAVGQVQPSTPLASSAAQRAAAFHERWVIGYGHSSVAEHAVAHVGVENISRLTSAELELANPFISFTEYSQRYQKPLRGHFFTPADLPAALLPPYQQTMHALYDVYEALYKGLAAHLDTSLPPIADESTAAREARIAKVAFEDARYVLPLCTLTNLGLTGNGRALRDCIAAMNASQLPESRTLATRIATEVKKVLPTLLRHTQPSSYQLSYTSGMPCRSTWQASTGTAAGPQVKLLNYTGMGAPNPEAAAIDLLTSALGATTVPVSELQDAIANMLVGLSPHDVLPQVFHWIRYDAHLLLSEAAWHQLLRHVRGMAFTFGPPEVAYGYTVPPNISAAGLADTLHQGVVLAEKLYGQLLGASPALAGYAVTNAHRRMVRTELNLRQLYHLVNLRVSEHAQWDIKDAVTQLWQQVQQVHPVLSAHASRRV